jgi:hypothetical protein
MAGTKPGHDKVGDFIRRKLSHLVCTVKIFLWSSDSPSGCVKRRAGLKEMD